jgi:MYXO-CTERM domain-containing protein
MGGWVVALVLVLSSTHARAATCNFDACSAQIQAAAGVVVNDIFHDANGRSAQQLPVYGTFINPWPGCPERVDFAGAGHDLAPYSCPGQYLGDSTTPTVASAGQYLNTLDRTWWQPCRLANPSTVDVGGTQCVADWTCIADGVGGNYLPWHGLVFDLGGPSNKAAVFASNDHGPQPCESLEYTVFLTDNPYARDVVLQPGTTGVDPQKWNRAVLSTIYTAGWTTTRLPDPANPTFAACGDTPSFSVETDSFVQVFSLPCGVTFRYASVVAGNDGLDFPGCAYDSNEAELDAVAGLTEGGVAVCPDGDRDHYVDCGCPGAPPVCDCNDTDPLIHPGAPEACDAAADVNCDTLIGTACGGGTLCHQGACRAPCTLGSDFLCNPGSTCTTTPQGQICLPDECGCVPGDVCLGGVCVNACHNVVCPGTQVCQDGNCLDPCAGIQCPQGTQCEAGQCVAPCSCYAGNTACTTSGNQCDRGNTNQCVAPSCVGVACQLPQACNPSTGTCDALCNAQVMCPVGQSCRDALGCVPLCTGVTCQGVLSCDPLTGQCVDAACLNITCSPPLACVGGQCVNPQGSSSSAVSSSSASGATSGATSGAASASGRTSGPSSSAAVSSATNAGTSVSLATSSGGGGSSHGSTGNPQSQGNSGAATSNAGGGSDGGGSSSCGCEVAPRATPAPAVVALVLGAAIRLRRRRNQN